VRALIGGVGYPDLSDHSISWAVVSTLEGRALPAGIAVEDVSYNPVAVAQRLDDEPAGQRYDVLVLVSAVARGRTPGAVTAYRWDRRLPAADEIQRAVTDAVTGIIYLDNTLVVVRHLGALPDRVVVMEVEPLVEAFGSPMSQPVADQLDQVCAAAVRYAADPRACDELPLCALGGPVVSVVHG
jgi:hydrogenase maturation protease